MLLEFRQKIADDGFGLDAALHAKARVGAGVGSALKDGIGDGAKGRDLDFGFEGGVGNDGAGADAAVFSDNGIAEDAGERLDDGVHADPDGGVDGDGFGTLDGDAGKHEVAGGALAEDAIDGGELDARVDAEASSAESGMKNGWIWKWPARMRISTISVR